MPRTGKTDRKPASLPSPAGGPAPEHGCSEARGRRAAGRTPARAPLPASGPAPGGPDAPAARSDPFRIAGRERAWVLGLTAALLVAGSALGFSLHPPAMLELLALIPPTFFAVGKFLPLWGITGQSQFGPYELGLIIWLTDTLTVLVLVYGIQLLYKVSTARRGLARIQSRAGLVLVAYPRIRGAALAGVFCFVLFPVAGTGAVGATFIGILLGLHRARLIPIVSAGGLVGGLGMAFAASHFRGHVLELEALQADPVLKYAIIAGAAIAVGLFLWWASRVYQRALEAAEDSAVASARDPS